MNTQFEFDWEPEPLDEVETPKPECTATEKILDRIKKLLRLATDRAATPAEAERAAALAFDLAERHHVDVAALNLDDAGESLIGEKFKCGSANPFTRAVSGIVRDYFHVDACFMQSEILFVGRETDVQIAGYMFAFFRRAGRASMREYVEAETRQKRKDTSVKRANFLAGFSWGVRDQLRKSRVDLQLTANQSALVLAEAGVRQEKMEELVPNTRPIKAKKMRNVRSAAMLGFLTGRKTQIRQPLGTSNQLRLVS